VLGAGCREQHRLQSAMSVISAGNGQLNPALTSRHKFNRTEIFLARLRLSPCNEVPQRSCLSLAKEDAVHQAAGEESKSTGKKKATDIEPDHRVAVAPDVAPLHAPERADHAE
jgi:hypothetical protein